MANNRIYLRCKQCGATLFLGKHSMAEYHWENYRDETSHLEDFLNKFFEEHCWCDKELNKNSLKGLDTPLGKYKSWDTIFEIAYEFDYKEQPNGEESK